MASKFQEVSVAVETADVSLAEGELEDSPAEPNIIENNFLEINKLKAKLEKAELQLREIRDNTEIKEPPNLIGQQVNNLGHSQHVAMPDNIVSILGGNPLSLVPQFNCNEEDNTEVERFVSALQQIALENQWSEAKKRYALESKLGLKAKALYFEGLGQDDTLSFTKRLDEFIKLFSKKLKPSESQQLFFSCEQKPKESVTSFKLRLVCLSLPLKTKLVDNTNLYEDFLLTQFVKGLHPEIRVELLKLRQTKFEDTVKSALHMEEIFKTVAPAPKKIVGVIDIPTPKQDIDILKKLEQLTLKIEAIKPVGFQPSVKAKIRCTFCNIPGHKETDCRKKHKPSSPRVGDFNKWCSICNKKGHWTSYCWFNKDPKEVNTTIKPLNDGALHN